MIELAAFTLHLRFTHADEIPAWLGRAAQAAFLDSLRTIHPTVAAQVHDGNGLKPFTASNLSTGRWGGVVRLHPHTPYTLRFTTLFPDLTTLSVNALVPAWLRDGLRLHEQPARVESVDTHTAAYAALLEQNAPAREIRLRFVSPTQFKLTHPQDKSDGIPMPLPIPERVFGSLIDRWMRFSPIPLHSDLREWVRLNVGIAAHRIETRTVEARRAGHGAYTGFVGEVTFTLLRREPPFAQQVAALAAFAPFAGVGIRTTNGMGQVELPQ
jgi:CRISPR-associated endoribonuclease Cas6